MDKEASQPSSIWPYKKAKDFVLSLKLKSAVEYQQWAAGKLEGKPARPSTVPSNPHQIYGKEWRGYGAWLGSKRVANFQRKFLPYDQARVFAARLGLDSYEQWRRYCSGQIPHLSKRPDNIPSNPNVVYKNSGWSGIRHWLGVGGPSEGGVSKMLPFEEARRFARSLGLSGQIAWWQYVAGDRPDLPSRPANVPSCPDVRYKHEGWAGYGDFLGTGNIANHRKTMRQFKEAREYARSLQLRTFAEWRTWAATKQRPTDIPSSPERTYSAKWRGWRDWLRAPYVRAPGRGQAVVC